MDSSTHNIVWNLPGWAKKQAEGSGYVTQGELARRQSGYNANAQNAAAQHVANLAQQRMAMQNVYGHVIMSPVMNSPMVYSGLMNIYPGPRPSTQEEIDYAEAMAEVEKICKEVKSRYELYDWVAKNEVDAIAPGWKE